MIIENAVYPSGEQLADAVARGGDGPIVMLNLLKFRERAVYKDGRTANLSGVEAYRKYGERMLPFVERHGGRMIFFADVSSLVIGKLERIETIEDVWDAVALVEYPSAEAFLKIALSPEVAEFGINREAGLAGQLLIQLKARALTP
jgi:uncharacterized protein (DUF1330 family)